MSEAFGNVGMMGGEVEFGALLERALRERHDEATPPAGLEQRLKARLAQEAERSRPLTFAEVGKSCLLYTSLREMVEQVRSVAALHDPLGRTLDAVELDEGLDMQKVSVPLGVLAVIFEARPDAVTQIAALAIKSGNTVILKPGSEVERTATALVGALRSALVRDCLLYTSRCV